MNRDAEYRDKGLILKHRRFGYFEPGREIGAISKLFSKSGRQFCWQDRAILDRLICIVRGARGKDLALYILGDNNSDLLRMMHFLFFGYKNVVILHDEGAHGRRVIPVDSDYLTEDLETIIKNIGPSELEHYIEKHFHSRICVVLLPGDSVSAQEELLSHMKPELQMYLIIRDFSFASTRFKANIFRKHGLNVSETADGYGELIAI